MSLPPIPTTIHKLVAPFINRSQELQDIDPLTSYYCKLYVAEMILEKGYHQQDAEIANFAVSLLDVIETEKAQLNKHVKFEKIINDQKLSFKYILNFALRIFNNCDNEQRSYISDKSTAQNFIKSCNFFEILNLFKDNDATNEDSFDWKSKVKYAKYHAARILKSIKAGQDPNEFKFEDEQINEEEEHELEAELKKFEDLNKVYNVNEQDKNSKYDDELVKNNDSDDIILRDTNETNIEFDDKVENFNNLSNNTLSDAPPVFLRENDDESGDAPQQKHEEKRIAPSKQSFNPKSDHELKQENSSSTTAKDSIHLKADINKFMESSEIITKSQKHARFAISALNYEDLDTGIKELESALQLLKYLKEA